MKPIPSQATMRRFRPLRPRRAIILLVVLGMLALFSLLTATYIIFTARARTSATSIGRRETRKLDSQVLLDQALGQVLRGTNIPDSSLVGHSLLEDFYGRDGLAGKVLDLNSRDGSGQLYIPDGRFGAEVMLGRGGAVRTGQFLKIPIQVGTTVKNPPNPFAPPFDIYGIEDALVGRYLVFTEGPLAGRLLEIMRSYGDVPPTRPNDNPMQPPVANEVLGNRYSVVVDLGPHLEANATIRTGSGPISDPVRNWLPANLAGGPRLTGDSLGLLYHDTPFGGDPRLVAGYQFRITPRPRNGTGLGWSLDGSASPPSFNLNQTFSPAQYRVDNAAVATTFANTAIPVGFQGNMRYYQNAALQTVFPAGDTDEPVDVADYRDYLLGYYPPEIGSPLVGITAPSGIRPALLNYLLHSFTPSGPVNPANWSVPQRLSLLRMLQRASLRPIAVINGNTNDNLGNPIDISLGQYAGFTGSNTAPADTLRRPIDVARLRSGGAIGTAEATHLFNVYQALINGPWDVDNDGDGRPDSVWIDAGIGMLTMPDGTLVRPMLALRVEDLDNRIDVNVVDSSASVATVSGSLVNQARINQFSGVMAGQGLAGTAMNMFTGFGVGPAEIVLQGVFRDNRSARMIAARYGSDSSPGVSATAASQAVSPFPFSTGNDTLSVWGALGRPPVHSVHLAELLDNGGNSLGRFPFPESTFGAPLDLHGRSMMALDLYGQPTLAPIASTQVALPFNVGLANDRANHPYEMLYKNVSGVDFAHSTSELEPVLRYRDWDRNEQPGRLRLLVDEELGLDESLNSGARVADDLYVTRDSLTHAITTVSATDNSPGLTLPREYASDTTVTGRSFDPVTRLALSLIVAAGERYSDPKFEVMFPIEFRRGERLNLNRPLGNGVNDQNLSLPAALRLPPLGNLTVDDAQELMAASEFLFDTPVNNPARTLGDFTPQTGRLPYGSSAEMNPEQLAVSSAWPASAQMRKLQNQESRVELARHLYVMTMLLMARRSGSSIEAYDFRADTTTGSEARTRARRIAQWAVNVVDFRDRDSIMTRFEYDSNPFNGWANAAAEMDVAWGYENSELRLTESFNFHDRRVKDTDFDNGDAEERFDGTNFVDDDLDQIRIPQGSTYLELYCTRGPKPLGADGDLHFAAPPELYSAVPRALLDDDNSNDGDTTDIVPVLDLGRLAPDGNPVWRIGISALQTGGGTPPSPQQLLNTMNPQTWDELVFAPEKQHQLSTPADPNFRWDRVIWFANQTPVNVGAQLPTDSRVTGSFPNAQGNFDRYKVYFNRFATADYKGNVIAGLQGGQYAVVGPRRRTYVGALRYTASTGPSSFGAYHANQYFDLHPYNQTDYPPGFQAFVPVNNAGMLATQRITPDLANAARPIIPILAAAEHPRNWVDFANTAPTGIGINISEPIPQATIYYNEPRFYLDSGDVTDNLNLLGYAKDAYFDYNNMGAPATIPDRPFDNLPNRPLENFEETGTREDFRTAYLQRLADPTSPYNPTFNPYVTVDWMSLDLTVFNGEEDNNQELGPDMNGNMEWIDPRDSDPFAANKNRFASRNSNGVGIDPTGGQVYAPTDKVLWTYGTHAPVDSSRLEIGGAYEPNYPMVVVYRNDWNNAFTNTNVLPPPTPDPTQNSFSMGFLNHAFGQRFMPGAVNAGTEMWVGAPAEGPFPSLGMFNRDFASPLEVMLVPASSNDRLMLEFSIPGAAPPNPYVAKPGAATGDHEIKREFGHLLNFFSHSPNHRLSPNLYRIFDFIETPDAFIESKELLDPVRLRNPETAREVHAMSLYFPPFNFVTQEMRAGRINLNTVNNPLVWRSLMFLHGTNAERGANQPGAFWEEWMLSRRGYGGFASAPLNRDVPTQFRGVLQSADSAWIAPNVRNNTFTLRRPGIQATLLRQLTEFPGGQQKTAFTRVGNAMSITPERDVRRNPFFRYQTAMRMPNLTSDNSNTFAVWLTLGFFQVDPATLTIGQEYGIDQGTNQRYRSFYIIDRSIPVDFVPGQETDTRKTILLERRID